MLKSSSPFKDGPRVSAQRLSHNFKVSARPWALGSEVALMFPPA